VLVGCPRKRGGEYQAQASRGVIRSVPGKHTHTREPSVTNLTRVDLSRKLCVHQQGGQLRVALIGLGDPATTQGRPPRYDRFTHSLCTTQLKTHAALGAIHPPTHPSTHPPTVSPIKEPGSDDAATLPDAGALPQVHRPPQLVGSFTDQVHALHNKQQMTQHKGGRNTTKGHKT
jgi:hypothetical protein